MARDSAGLDWPSHHHYYNSGRGECRELRQAGFHKGELGESGYGGCAADPRLFCTPPRSATAAVGATAGSSIPARLYLAKACAP
jgi:hypothetical protein